MTTGIYTLYVDWDNNLDFSDATEDLTNVTLNVECSRGRDYASQLTGRSIAGQLRAILNNESGDYSSFNTSSAIAGNIVPGRKVQLCASNIQPLVMVSVTKDIAAAGDYAAEDVLSESASAGTAWTFADVALRKGEALSIVKAQAICEVTSLTPRLTLYLFTSTPTCALNDNVANTAVLHADLANYIGKINFPVLEDLGGDSESLATPGTYGNLPIEFECASTNTSIYGVLVTRDAITGESAGMDLTIRLTVERANNPLWTGYLQSIKPCPSVAGVQTVELVAIGSLGFLNQRDTETAMKTAIATGAAITEVLDKASYPEFPRTLDTGQTTMDRFWVDKQKTLSGLRKVEDTESGFLTESSAGYIVFEDRHHRMKSPHLTSQATYTDAPGGTIGYIGLNQEDPLQQIFNIFEAEVKTYTVGSSATLWVCPESGASSPLVPAGSTATFWASYPTAGDVTNAMAVDAWTTLAEGTDFITYTAPTGGTLVTGSVTFSLSKFSNAMKMVATNASTQHLYLTTFQARGTPITVSDPLKVKAEDSTSKTTYGERTYPHPGEFIPTSTEAKSWGDFHLSVFKDPQPILLVTLHANRSQSHLAEAMTRDISDRITLVANNSAVLGINQDFFIEAIYHRIQADLSHKITFALSPATMWGEFWVWDVSVWDVNTKWAY